MESSTASSSASTSTSTSSSSMIFLTYREYETQQEQSSIVRIQAWMRCQFLRQKYKYLILPAISKLQAISRAFVYRQMLLRELRLSYSFSKKVWKQRKLFITLYKPTLILTTIIITITLLTPTTIIATLPLLANRWKLVITIIIIITININSIKKIC